MNLTELEYSFLEDDLLAAEAYTAALLHALEQSGGVAGDDERTMIRTCIRLAQRRVQQHKQGLGMVV